MIAETTALSVLLSAAAATGVVHTLLGPDHWLPLLALAREREWNGRRALSVTAVAGLLHCAASAVLVPVAVLLASSLVGVQELRGSLAAWLLLGTGVALLFTAWRRRRSPSSLVGRSVSSLLLLAFALGPCEWLIPNAMAAWSEHGVGGAALVASVFTVATIITMTGVVALGLRLLPSGLRASGAWTGAACVLSGALILVGL